MADEIENAKAETNLQDFQSIFRLDGKVAVVTGGSRGLGLHAASGLLQAGCSKVFITSRKANACAAACEVLNALPNKAPGAVAIPLPADNSKPAEIDRLVQEVSKYTDHLDILLANAGVAWGAAFDKHPIEGFAKVMDLNVKSVFYTIQKCVTAILESSKFVDQKQVHPIAPSSSHNPRSFTCDCYWLRSWN
jgi:NAD(P)-dependent dehydrogenase (short-subunit alcohol dehydrogenase family)